MTLLMDACITTCATITYETCAPPDQRPMINSEHENARIATLADRFGIRPAQVRNIITLTNNHFPVMEMERGYANALANKLSSLEWQAKVDKSIEEYRAATTKNAHSQ